MGKEKERDVVIDRGERRGGERRGEVRGGEWRGEIVCVV